MAKRDLANALKTDVSDLAQIVRSKGRGRDTILAHITPREAKKLKREGGRGSTNPETGLLEFEDGSYFDPTPISYQGFDFQAPSYTQDAISQPIQAAPQQDYSFLSTPQGGFQQPYQAAQYTGGFQPFTGGDYYAGSFPNQYAQAAPLVFGPGGVPSASNFFVPRAPAPVEAKTDVRAPALTAADVAAQRGYYTTPEGIDVATTPEGSQFLTEQQMKAEEGQKIADEERARIADQARGQDARGAPPVAGAAGAAAGAAQQQNKASEILAGSGFDVSKASTADMSKVNQIMTMVNNGAMTLDQAAKVFQNMAQGQTFSGGLSNWLSDPGNSLKLALGLGIGALGMYNQSNARKQAADVSNQMKGLASQYATMAQPLLQQGGQQFGLAAQGALTPASQQQFDVGRAQLAQAAAKTGSVGAMQATQIAEQMRQSALNSQMTQGLQVLAAGNAQMGRSGIQARCCRQTDTHEPACGAICNWCRRHAHECSRGIDGQRDLGPGIERNRLCSVDRAIADKCSDRAAQGECWREFERQAMPALVAIRHDDLSPGQGECRSDTN